MTDNISPLIFAEIRNEHARQVSFAAMDLESKQMLFSDLSFEEPWWITLNHVSQSVMLLTIYNDTNNPDNKSLVAYDINARKLLWWRNNFAVNTVKDDRVEGTETGVGMKFLTLDLLNGEPCETLPGEHGQQNFLLQKPLQYYPDTGHFETVKKFLEKKVHKVATSLVEYLEFGSLIFISFYVAEPELANYLLVLDKNGQILLDERIGERLKGIGVDTFFLLSGYLIFVKNKRELISYRMI